MEQLRTNSMAWLERTNPLRGLSISRAGSVYDAARVQGSPRLQYMYNEIESTDPVLMTCVERRQSALAGLKRTFVARPAADPTLADEQRDALERFADGIDNFDAAIETMDEAFFRGYCHLQPLWDGDAVHHIVPLKSWNFLRSDDGTWLWNPLCHETTAGLDDVRGARLVTLERRRSIDWPALFIYIRKALGERDYGRFIERHGIPHAAIIMAPGTEEKDVGKYVASSNAWSNGQDIALPNGASIDLATEARGTDPFTPFVEHQDKYIVLLATGGTLTSLAQADTGTLAGGAQMEVWREIVARDGILIADALNRCLFRRYIERAFPGRPMAAEFRLENDKTPTPTEVADLAGKLKAAGYTIDQGQLESAVGFKLEREEGEVEKRGGGGQWNFPVLNKSGTSGTAGTNGTALKDTVLAAFAADNGPAAEAIAGLLKDPSKERAEALMADINNLMPEDPALAAVIAEEMAKAFGQVEGWRLKVEQRTDSDIPEANREHKRETDGKFSEVDHPRDFKPGKNPDSAETQSSEIGKGKSAVEKCLSERCDVFSAVVRSDIGPIDFIYGDETGGIAHIAKKHGDGVLKELPDVLVRGEAGSTYQHGQKLNITHGPYTATLRLDRDGENEKWVLTLFGKRKEG